MSLSSVLVLLRLCKDKDGRRYADHSTCELLVRTIALSDLDEQNRHREEFQPVTIFTKLARRVPFWIRTSLGTDLPDVGFSVTYKRQPDGVWFPVSFGTEFHLHAVFFINREITVSLQNGDFEKTHIDSVVHYESSNLY